MSAILDWFAVARRDEPVAVFEVEEAHTLGVAADDAQVAGSNADHLSAFGDQHQAVFVVHRMRADHFTVTLGGLDADNFTPCDFIAAISQHIPDKSFQLVRYYGLYSNKMRGQCLK